MNFRNILYAFTCLSFSIIIGAGIYEHSALWPAAFSAPPKSLSVFQGPYKLDAAAFWIPIHPVTLVLFAVTLFMSWNTARRRFVLIPMIGYVVILLATFTFFVPELLELTGATYSDSVDESLQVRGSRWITLSLIRAGILIMLAFTLFIGLTKGTSK